MNLVNVLALVLVLLLVLIIPCAPIVLGFALVLVCARYTPLLLSSSAQAPPSPRVRAADAARKHGAGQ